MQAISDLYREYLQQRDRTWLIKVNIAGTDYGSETIVDFTIDNDLSDTDGFTVGTAISSKLVLRLKNITIPANARIVPYLALQLPESLNGADMAWQDADIVWQDADFPWGGNVTEWLPLGEFFVDTRAAIQGNILELTCADRLRFADVQYISGLTYPTSMQAVWDEICGLVGYGYGDTVKINSTYQIQAGPAGYSARQVLSYIAMLHGACIFVDRWGLIQWRQFSAVDTPVAEFTKSDYAKVSQTNPEKTYTRLVVIYNSDDGLAFERGSGDENHTLTVENPFATPDMVDDLFTRLNGFSYTPVTMDVRGYPQFDAGDRIRFGTTSAYADLTWDTADIAWQDADFTWDGFDGSQPGGNTLLLHLTYSFKGGLKMSFDAPSKSEQQSEYQVQGSLSQALDRLRTTALREGKSYFGVTVTREDGLTVEREDHASKVILNSDELAWFVNGNKSLYYDAQSNRLKFTGTLDGVDGVFSGSLSGATGTFNGLYTGTIKANQIDVSGGKITAGQIDATNLNVVNGTFSGQLNAASGSFSGTITASSIQGGTIDGTTITGALIRTASSGSRIELNSTGNLLTAYYNDSNYIDINPIYGSGPAIEFFYGGARVGSIVTSGPNIWLNAQNQLTLNALGGIYISGGWAGLFASGGNSLQTELNNKLNSSVQRAVNLTYDATTKNLKLWDASGTILATVNISGS